MPRRDMEDTWNPAELENSLKGSKEDSKKRDKSRDRRKERPKGGEEKPSRGRRNDDGQKKDKDRDKRDRGGAKDKSRERMPQNAEAKGGNKGRPGNQKEGGKGKGQPSGKDEGQRRRHHRDETDEERKKRKEERRSKRDGDGKERRRRHRDDDEQSNERQKDGDEDRNRHNGEGEDGRNRSEERRRHREHKEEKERKRSRERKQAQEEKEQEQMREEEDLAKTKEMQRKKSPRRSQDEDDYNYDDDDFEDYEEDFEEDDEEESTSKTETKKAKQMQKESPPATPRSVRDITSGYIRSRNWEGDNESRKEMDDILKAMDAENQRLVNSVQDDQLDEVKTTKESKKPPANKRAFINFVSAKQRQVNSKASKHAKIRGQELLRLIELDRVAFDLFDMPPVSEYELYMRTFGRSDTQQRYIQTNEDNLDKDIQTEEIETVEKWVQWPPEATKGYGGDKETEEEEEASKQVDTVALTKFVQSAGQAILILLEEDRAEANQSDSTKKCSNICLSEAFLEIEAPVMFKNRCVSCTQFSEAQTHMLLTVYDRPDKKAGRETLYSQGSICVWNVNEPSHPQKVLVCESQPRCCCFSPAQATLVFAGMMDGSVAVWDLREPNSLHKQIIEGDITWFLRYPTYNTAGVLHYENHQSAVTSILPIYVPGHNKDSDVEGSTSFQLATVEETATVHLWVVAEIAQPDPAGSESDLGLSPGGRIKLIKSSSIVLENPLRDARLRTAMTAFEMKLLPSDPSHFYVGTDTGHVIHGVRFGGKAPPRAYRLDIDAPLDVTSIDFSPFTEPVFLTGCSDGSIRLYHINRAAPIIVWESTTGGRPVLTVRWCQSRPNVFFVVDTSSRLYIWDLLMSDAIPMKEEVISKDRLTSFCLCSDFEATGQGMPGRKPAMVVSFETGRVEVHTMSQQFSALMPEEVDQFAQFLGYST